MPLCIIAVLFLRISAALVVRDSGQLERSQKKSGAVHNKSDFVYKQYSNLLLRRKRVDTWDADGENPWPPALDLYNHDALLGEGSFGRVTSISSKCGRGNLAVKIIKYSGRQEAAEIKQEAQTMKTWSDTNLPFFLKFYTLDFFTYYPGNRPKTAAYMIMERAESSFMDLIESHHGKGYPNESELLIIFVDAAKAVAVMHEKGMFHSDIKPDNVMVIGGHGVLIDFGLTCPSTSESPVCSGGAGGTPSYLPPECWTGKCTNGQSFDIFSLGAMLYEMFTQDWPVAKKAFTSTDEHTEIQMIKQFARKFKISKDESFQKFVPDGLKALMEEMLSTDPAERPTSADVAERVIEYLRRGGTSYKERERSAVHLPAFKGLLPPAPGTGLCCCMGLKEMGEKKCQGTDRHGRLRQLVEAVDSTGDLCCKTHRTTAKECFSGMFVVSISYKKTLFDAPCEEQCGYEEQLLFRT